ncbi:hypothetical protein WN943_009549 [Citrus x changshan-huyou]
MAFKLEGFGHHIGYCDEILAVILAIEASADYGQTTLCLETYSMLVLHLFDNPKLDPPSVLRNRFINFHSLIDSVDFDLDLSYSTMTLLVSCVKMFATACFCIFASLACC